MKRGRKILVLVGLKGSGKTEICRFLSGMKWPTVEVGGDTAMRIRNLLAAGQRRIAVDGVESLGEWKRIKAEFPEDVLTVGMVAPKEVRRKRVQQARGYDKAVNMLRTEEIIESEKAEMKMGVGDVLLGADEYIVNDGSIDEMIKKAGKIISKYYEQ
jgi:dephospho-CoA kinase